MNGGTYFLFGERESKQRETNCVPEDAKDPDFLSDAPLLDFDSIEIQ